MYRRKVGAMLERVMKVGDAVFSVEPPDLAFFVYSIIEIKSWRKREMIGEDLLEVVDIPLESEYLK